MARQSQRLKFRSAAEAREEAEQMEQLRDAEVSELREQGNEAEADRRVDRWNQEIKRVQAQARELDEREASETPQPDLSALPAAGKQKRRGGGARRRSGARGGSGGRSRSGAGPVARTVRSGYRRSGAQAQAASWGDLAWQITGLTLLIAFVTLFVSSSRGVSAFGGLTMGLANGLGLFVDTVDPLAKGAVASTVEAARPPTAAGRVMTSTVPRMA